jgi:hypothetical protein
MTWGPFPLSEAILVFIKLYVLYKLSYHLSSHVQKRTLLVFISFDVAEKTAIRSLYVSPKHVEIMPWSFSESRRDSRRISGRASAVPISDGRWYANVDVMQPMQQAVSESGSKLQAQY